MRISRTAEVRLARDRKPAARESWCAGVSTLRVLFCLFAASGLALLWLLTSPAPRTNTPRGLREIGDLRGEPIDVAPSNAPASTIASNAALVAGTNPSNTQGRRKRPKPASFQHRMVEFQVSQNEGTNRDGGFGGSPAKVIYSPAQLAALSGPPLPAGCEDLDFVRLSGFPFEVTTQMADGAKDPVSASAATRAKIPESVQALDNRFVAIRGFLLPLRTNNGLTIEFLLLRNQNMCCFGSVPKINEWVCVQPAGEGVKPIMDQPITIIGRLRVGEIRENGYLVGIYRMDNAQVYIPSAN